MSAEIFGVIIIDSASKITETFSVPVLFDTTVFYQARYTDKVTCLIYDNGEFGAEQSSWGFTEKGGTIFTLPMNKILKQRPWNVRIHKARAVVPVNGILIKDIHGNPFILRSVDHRTIGVGVLISRLNNSTYQHAILTTEPPNTFKDKLEQVPVLMPPETAKRWLKTKNLQHIMKGMDQVHRLWLDLVPVNKTVLKQGNEREWLKPIGPSLNERNRRLRSEQDERIEKDRPKRGK